MTTLIDPSSPLSTVSDPYIHILVGPFVTKACSSDTPSSDIDQFLRDKNLGQSVTDCFHPGLDDVLTDFDTKTRLFSNTYFLVRTPLHKNVWIFQIFPPDPPTDSPLSPFLFSFKYRFFSKKQQVYTVLVWNRENVVTICCAHPLLQLKPIQKISSFLLRHWKKTHPHLRIHSFFIPSMTTTLKNSSPTLAVEPNIFHLQDGKDPQDSDPIGIDLKMTSTSTTTTVTPFPPVPITTEKSITLPPSNSTVIRKRPFTLVSFVYLFVILILLTSALAFYYYYRHRHNRNQHPSPSVEDEEEEEDGTSRSIPRSIPRSTRSEESTPKRFENGVRGRKPRVFHNDEEFVNQKHGEHQRKHNNRNPDRIKDRRLKW